MGKQEGKKLTKKGGTKKREAASPSPKGKPPQAPPKEGMCLTGYGILGVGKMKGGRNQA